MHVVIGRWSSRIALGLFGTLLAIQFVLYGRPVFANVAPASWLVQHDVDEARAALNFSEWSRPQKEADEASEEVRDGEMPPTRTRCSTHTHA